MVTFLHVSGGKRSKKEVLRKFCVLRTLRKSRRRIFGRQIHEMPTAQYKYRATSLYGSPPAWSSSFTHFARIKSNSVLQEVCLQECSGLKSEPSGQTKPSFFRTLTNHGFSS
jgi:hypothetical protein